MINCIPLLSLLGLLQLHGSTVAANDLLSCACALEESNNVLDCSISGDVLVEAQSKLQTNACELDCSNPVCQANYYLIQAHHDYCLPSDIPAGLSTAFHNYEEHCKNCHVIRKTSPSLNPCPAANCDNNSGNFAYSYLLLENCKAHCNTDPECGTNFRTLRAVYDICPDGTVGKVAELGLNNLAEPCAEQDCNTGDASTDASQLVCSDSIATHASRPTGAPTPAPDVVCPEPVQTSSVTSTVCSACGPNQCVTRPDAVFAWPGRPPTKCSDIQDAGLGGYLTIEYCEALPDLMNTVCGCQVADLYAPYTPPGTFAPTSSPSSSSSSGVGLGLAIGLAAAGVVFVAGVALVWSRRRSPPKTVSAEASAEIEIPNMNRTSIQEGMA